MRSPIACALFAALLLSTGCGGPIGPVPGGALSGEEASAPSDWSFANDVKQVQVETSPARPYSVNTWVGSVRGKLYVPTSMILGPENPAERTWVQNVLRDGAVRVRVAGKVYALSAVRVTDSAEYASVLAALDAKYELAPGDRDPVRAIWIFRMQPR